VLDIQLFVDMEPSLIPVKRDFHFAHVKFDDVFSKLPSDVKCEIFSYFTSEELLGFRLISKRFNELISLSERLWFLKTQEVFSVNKKLNHNESWFECYKQLSRRFCEWDTEAHHPGITIDSTSKMASCDVQCRNDTHLPIRGAQGVKSGKHYFEISFDGRSDTRAVSFSSLLCAVGVADASFATDRKVGSGYTKENNGIGYYSSGFQFAYGKELEYGSRVIYKIGDTVGLYLDMDNGILHFYKDGKKVGKSHTLRPELLGKVELFPLVLSERGLVITITKKNGLPTSAMIGTFTPQVKATTGDSLALDTRGEAQKAAYVSALHTHSSKLTCV